MSEGPRLKVFISWSGDLARTVAKELHALLPVVFDRVEPWFSDRDIDAGLRGLHAVAGQLDDTGFGIVVVTRGNQDSQWLNFEAGALSKRFSEDETSHVVPLLVDMAAVAELTGPMAQFQAKLLDRQGVEDTLITIGQAVGVSPDVVKRRLNSEWDEFSDKVAKARSQSRGPSATPKRPLDSMVEETLELVRSLAQSSEGIRNSLQHSVRPSGSGKSSDISALVASALGKFGLSTLRITHGPNDYLQIEVIGASGIDEPQKLDVYRAVESVLKVAGPKYRGFSLIMDGQSVPPF